jgi:hypothetical protein
MLRRVDLVRADVSEEHSASIIRVTRIGELGMLAVTSVILMMEALHSSETPVLTRQHDVTSQKMAFFNNICIS